MEFPFSPLSASHGSASHRGPSRNFTLAAGVSPDGFLPVRLNANSFSPCCSAIWALRVKGRQAEVDVYAVE